MGGGKSGGIGQTYDYFGSLAGGVCIGPNEDLVAILINSAEVWPKGTAWAVGITCAAGTLYVFDAQTWTCSSTHVASTANAPGSGLEGWTEYVFTRGSENYDDFSLTASDGTYYGVMRFYWGTAAQTVDPVLASTGNDGGVQGYHGYGDQHPDYEGVSYVVIKDFLLGQEVQSGPNIEIVTRRKPNQSLITGGAAGITDGQANLAAVAVELLTDENCLALSATMLDATSFAAVAALLQTNQAMYGASVLIDTSESVTSLFDKLVQMFDGYIRFNPATQKIELGMYRHGIVPGAYTTLTADSFTKIPKFTVKSWQNTVSRANIRYNARQINYQQTSLQVDDPRAFFVLGSVREQSLDRPWIARDSQAMIHGRELLRVAGHAQMTGDLTVRREIGRGIRAGDYVLVDVDLEPNTNSIYQFFRVTERSIPPTGPITLKVFGDNTLAAVPWMGAGSPVTITEPAVPAITSFRVLEVPTVLAGQRGAIAVLAERPNNLMVGSTVYFDTDPAGTFSANLGIFSNFAAKATLRSNVAIADLTLHVSVDTTQVDADYFTQQFAALQQQNDTMLAILVQVVGSGAAAGQVDELNGYQIMEICSVGAQTLYAAGQYDLAVLRGRQNTIPSVFATATCEVWLIPRSLLTFFSGPFDQLRANRLAGLTPALAQFRFCPFTFTNALALSDATSEPFRFPLNSVSAPSLTLFAPTAFVEAYAAASFPYVVPVTGTWSDPDGNLVQYRILARLSTDTADRVITDLTFAPCAQANFSANVQLDAPGIWTIKLIARDATNLTTERDITVTVTGSSTKTCATVDILDVNSVLVASISANGTTVGQFIPYGLLQLRCSTPGSTIYFQTSGVVYSQGQLSENSLNAYAYNQTGFRHHGAGYYQPFHGLLASMAKSYTLLVYAKAAGYADSAQLQITIPLYY